MAVPTSPRVAARARRVPTAQLPRSDGRYGLGAVAVGFAHVVAVGLLVILQAAGRGEETEPVRLGGGGGGGGGGTEIRFVALPPAPRAAPRARSVTPEVSVPTPALARVEQAVKPDDELVTPQVVRPPIEDQLAPNILTAGSGSGFGVGPGMGSGVGGGTGSGNGTGVGSGTGPGVSSEEVAYAPEPRAIVYPFESPPASVRGRQFRIYFWVDARGSVDRVEVRPEIEDAAFRRLLIERVSSWTFYPARTIEGRPVAGQLVVVYAP